MPIVYPLPALPASPTFRFLSFTPVTIVGVSPSLFTGKEQVFVWQGQWWRVSGQLPPMNGNDADAWVSWKLSLNGRQGTFYLSDVSRRTSRGNPVGYQVGAGAVANSTTLPLQAGTGAFVVADWLSVGDRLHKVTKVNAGSVDVWPRLRSAYAQGTVVVTTNAAGLFRLASNDMAWDVDSARIYGLSLEATEVLP
jgi:hypothetical protein